MWNFTKPWRLSRHFPPRLELLIFPEGWRAELLIFPEFRLRIRARCSPALVQTFPTALGVVDFSRRLAARPCEIFSKPWHQSGHFPPTPRVVGFSLRKVATVWVFHQALAPSWAFFAHCFGQRTFPRASACGIFIDGVWYPGTSEKLALTTSGGNDALSPALWKSPQRCVSVRRWVCAVLGPARHSLARVQRFARRRAHMLSEDYTSTAPAHCLAQCISWVVARTRHFCMSTEHVS